MVHYLCGKSNKYIDMRKEILEALGAKFAGVEQAILSRVADKLAKTASGVEEVKTLVEGFTLQKLLESYGDSRATEAQQTAVKNYEQKFGLKNGEKVVSEEESAVPKEEQAGGDLSAAIAAAVAAAVKPLQDKLASIEGGRIRASREEKLLGIVGKLPASLQKAYGRINVEGLSDEEFEALTAEVSSEVSSILSETKARGAVMGRPLGIGSKRDASKEATDTEVNAVVEKLNL